MTKADIVNEIASRTGLSKVQVLDTIDSFIEVTKETMISGKNIYMRGFGTFQVKKRAKKVGRNISKNITMVIPAHNIPAFKPSKEFLNQVKESVKA